MTDKTLIATGHDSLMRWKDRFRYPFDLLKASRCLELAATARTKQQARSTDDRTDGDQSARIVLDLHHATLLFDGARHLQCIATHAMRLDLSVILRCRKRLLGLIAHKVHGAEFLSMPNVYWQRVQREGQRWAHRDKDLVLTDRLPATEEFGDESWSLLCGRTSVDGLPVMPYPMFPCHIDRATPEYLAEQRSTVKNGVFFAGNLQPRYSRDTMERDFKMLSRGSIVSALQEHFADRMRELTAAGDPKAIVLRDARLHPIQTEQWLATLAEHRFFICCPGVAQPVCHNIVEAMSVGCVPLVEYGSRMHPPLEDNVNAICFEGKTGLIEAFDRIDSMSGPRLQELSANVCAYYDRHLCGSSFLRQLQQDRADQSPRFVLMPFHSEDLFDPEAVERILQLQKDKSQPAASGAA